MTLDDILWSITHREVPGRNAKIAYKDIAYDSGTIASGGADISFTLPAPNQGYVRRWESLVIITNTIAAADQIFFSRLSSDLITGTVLWYINGVTIAGNFSWPVILGRATFFGAGAGVGVNMQGIDPMIVGPEDKLTFFVDYNAPVAQSITVRGFYKDLPV